MTREEYIEEREKLIPKAEEIANMVAGPRPPGERERWAAIWNRTFHGMMDNLARERGLTN